MRWRKDVFNMVIGIPEDLQWMDGLLKALQSVQVQFSTNYFVYLRVLYST